jgi:ubiquinone/menaquinone biosynthesis C-methylase UbiE
MLLTVTKTESSLVEQHFHADTLFWKNVYLQDTLNGAIYRERRAGVLKFVDSLCLAPGSRALDVGCGAGSTSIALATRKMRVEAVDAVPEMVGLTRQAVADAGFGNLVGVRTGDVCRLEFAADFFDLAVAVGVMEWMPSFAAPLKELYRVLRPGGWVIVNVDNSRALQCLLDPRMSPLAGPLKRYARRLAERAGFIEAVARPTRCSPRTLDRALRTAGFVKITQRTSGFGPFTMLGTELLPDGLGVALHRSLQRMADRHVPLIRNGGDTYLVMAQKRVARS